MRWWFCFILACGAPVTGDTESNSESDSGNDAASQSNAITFHDDIRPIMARSCDDCHGPQRTSFDLSEYSVAAQLSEQIASAVESNSMPPWPPDPECHPVHNPGALSESDRAIFRQWADTGAKEGVPKDNSSEPRGMEGSFESDKVITMAQPYMPDERLTDDYRCFVIEPELAEDVWVTGFKVEVGNSEMVHHTILWTDTQGASYALDEADDGEGYTCFGGPGFNDTSLIGGWAPGVGNFQIPEGRGLEFKAGSPVVLQQHYFTAADPGGLDQTEVHLDLTDDPVLPIYFVPFAIYDLDIPAGEPAVTISDTTRFDLGFDLKVFGGIPHMHKLGTTIEVTRSASDQEDECLMKIPEWDFNLQGIYSFDEPVVLEDGDELTLNCTYDNSTQNPNQHTDPPQDVSWGDGTNEEMCLFFAMVGL